MYLTEEQKSAISLEFETFVDSMYAGKTKKERQELDQFFTPADLTIKMLEALDCTYEEFLDSDIIDPTSGSGNLLAAALIIGVDSDKVFGNEYDETMIKLCRERLNKVCDILGKPHIKDWQIHQGNALHKFALTYFGEDYEEMYFDGCTQKAARNKKLNNESYNAYLQSSRFKKKYPELYEEELSLNLNTIQKKQAEATGSFDLFGGLF